MAEDKTVSIVPLNGLNYPTWNVQCRMALMKDGLWTIVDGTEGPSLSTRRTSIESLLEDETEL